MLSNSLSRAVRKRMGSVAERARSSRHSAKPAVDLVAEADVDHREVRAAGLRKASMAEGAVGVGGDVVALLAQRVPVVVAQRRSSSTIAIRRPIGGSRGL